MIKSFRSIAFAILCACLSMENAAAQPVCKPVLTVKNVSFSPMYNWIRSWAATIDVDASKCATSSGLYSIRFVRLSEDAPDLEFTEPLIWRSGQIKVFVDFAAGESVQDYRIDDIATCPCRRD
jgi:hypothetical protein